jgi:hypothetical protein
MSYIGTNHIEAAEFIKNISWAGGREDMGLLGSEKYVYNGAGWTVTIEYPVVPDPLYSITANYSAVTATIHWQGTCQNGTVTETGYITSNMPSQVIMHQNTIGNVLDYMKTYHNETAQYIKSEPWMPEKITSTTGTETYLYKSQNWNLTLQYPFVPNPTFTISANHTEGDIYIAWEGTWQNGTTLEISYINNQLSTQEQIRDAVMNYIRTTHAETVQYAQNFTWIGGRSTPSGIVGSETYSYQSEGWNLTIQYPVVPNAIYNITASYQALCSGPSIPVVIVWQGSWQTGTITETSYNIAY